MSKIGTTQVSRIASLARIQLSDEETASMSVELGRIVEFVEQLRQTDVTTVKPTDQVTGLQDVWRSDHVTPSPDRQLMLKNAPQSKHGYIVVKRVLNG